MLLSNVAGIGGGGVAIPLAMYFFSLSMKPAIAISSFAILCSTLARFLYNFNERHPEKPNCTSIDYGMTTVMMPLTLIGSLLGAYVYMSFPDLILLIILTLLLALLTIESGKKYYQMKLNEIKCESKLNKIETEMTVNDLSKHDISIEDDSSGIQHIIEDDGSQIQKEGGQNVRENTVVTVQTVNILANKVDVINK